MADIASAIKMEEEAFKRLKRQSLRKTSAPSNSSMKGISNPNCQFNYPKSSSKPTSQLKPKETGPDLMSFQDVMSGDAVDSIWTNKQNTLKSVNSDTQLVKSAYDKTTDEVLSLFNSPIHRSSATTMPPHQPPFYQQTVNLGYQRPTESFFSQNMMPTSPAHHGYTSNVQSDSTYYSSHPYSGISNFSQTPSLAHMKGNVTVDNSNLGLNTGMTLDSMNEFPRPSSMGQLDGNINKSAVVVKSHLDGNQAHAFVVGSSRNSRSSSFGSKKQESFSEPPQDARLTSVFDEWLNDGWTSNSTSASPQHEGTRTNTVSKEDVPNWLEWDPLNESQKESPERLKPHQEHQGHQTFAGLARADSGFSTVNEKHEQTFSQKEDMDSIVELDELSELEHFARSLSRLRSGYVFEDTIANPGHVVSPMSTYFKWNESRDDTFSDDDDKNTAVRILVTADGIDDPVTFECDVNSSVEHIVSQALCIAFEDISCVSTDDFMFKVAGRQEYLISKTRLSLYQYVQECRKFEQDIRLELLHKSKIDRSLRRTADDDSTSTIEEDFLSSFPKPVGVVSRNDIQVLLESFYKETEKFLHCIEQESNVVLLQQHFDHILQTVKALCSALGNIEVHEISDSVKSLNLLLNRPVTTNNLTNRPASESSLSETFSSLPMSVKVEKLRDGLEALTSAMLDYTQLYCKAYQTDAYFRSSSSNSRIRKVPTILSSTVRDLFSVKIVSLHRIPRPWETQYDEFYISCAVCHGNRKLNNSKSSTRYVKVATNFYSQVYWNEWVEFDVAVCELPLEAKLRLTLHGVHRTDDKVVEKKLTWLNISLFDQKNVMRHSNGMFGMWDFSKYSKSDRLNGPQNCDHDILNSENVVVYLTFTQDKEASYLVRQDSQVYTRPVQWKSVDELDVKTRTEFNSAVSRARLTAGPLFNLSQREKDVIWQNRLVADFENNDSNNIPSPSSSYDEDRDTGRSIIRKHVTATVLSLPILLQCVPSWSPILSHLHNAHDLLAAWPKPLEPEQSLELLTFTYPDSRVRSAAIKWLEQAGDTEFSSWLPQLVQALRCEPRHDSQLARLLLRRALGNITICHQLYWLLYDNMWDSSFVQRYTVLHAALTTICGTAMKKEFEKENYFIRKINKIAEEVKQAKDANKSLVLSKALNKVVSLVNGNKFRIPTNPALVTTGVAVKNSSYFSSNAVPLKLSFINSDLPDSNIFIMYKVGDDLRQDALTMQLIRVMNRMWLCEGLDLRIVTFDCLPTGPNKGMVEIVPDSKTFREIQSSYGLAGAFKDRPIAEWLQKYNPTGLSYERAVENFTLSCAGYCVATYVLGICDRHNDNIMLRSSGHLFHIDFARFLGHAQMFGNIKRDRAPFVLTSDMAYVINGGDRPSSKFQDFVDVCCLAFNILRKHAHTIINLLSLMLHCGIPELSSRADLKYVYDTLKPNASDTEATTMFTRLIESSLSSSFTRFNFFIHNLAQMRFHANESEEDKKILSFSPQIHGYKEEEGVIKMASVVEYQKRYNPEKFYIYCVKVTRERHSSSIDSYVFRTFDEFEELHRKLSFNTYAQLPNFPNSVVVGRSQVKQVAEKRKEKLNSYLRQLLKSNRNVAMHDLVYTFFHPILRDEEKETSPTLKTPDFAVGGEIKVSLHYKNNALFIMIHHCKNLSQVDGTDPDPYVKTYLFPDPYHATKRKTKVARKTLHPTYNEMLVYRMPFNDIKLRQLYVGVWNYENFQENDFMGNVVIDLSTVDLSVDSSKWYLLKSGAL